MGIPVNLLTFRLYSNKGGGGCGWGCSGGLGGGRRPSGGGSGSNSAEI